MLTSAPRSGELRELVDIQTPPATRDSQGGRSGAWGTLETGVWARVRAAANQGEALRAAAVTAQTRYEVVIRYRSDVTTLMRLSWLGKTLQIQGAAPMDSGHGIEWLVLDCTETT
jgi:SPP1 family predicted phage head-tail adaptor